jgi:lysophospholipase L1-like esterase
MTRHLLLSSLLLFLVPPAAKAADSNAAAEVSPSRWAADMEAFDKLDAKKAPAPGGVVFVGSSSIRLWNLKQSFPKLVALNRGFGGSHLSDSVAEVDRLVLRHKPRVVVLYAGDNDIAGGKSAERVVKDFEAFVAAIHKELPETKVVYVGIKPSLARWRLADEMQKANTGIKAVCEKSDRCVFVDVWTPMLGEDGTPRKDLFVFDGLHMSPAGYAIWAKLVGPELK